MAEFITRIDSPQNEIWRAELGCNIVGSISIDGENLDDGLAHLRWFIVDDELRGGEVGNALLSQLLDFCDEREFHETHLWTVKGLDAARNFMRTMNLSWSMSISGISGVAEVVEQKFVRLRRH